MTTLTRFGQQQERERPHPSMVVKDFKFMLFIIIIILIPFLLFIVFFIYFYNNFSFLSGPNS